MYIYENSLIAIYIIAMKLTVKNYIVLLRAYFVRVSHKIIAFSTRFLK